MDNHERPSAGESASGTRSMAGRNLTRPSKAHGNSSDLPALTWTQWARGRLLPFAPRRRGLATLMRAEAVNIEALKLDIDAVHLLATLDEAAGVDVCCAVVLGKPTIDCHTGGEYATNDNS
mmetsp:Transcript_51870/g.121329  ORF Transcript_51870/g.121329 Transcript_51870/m.121329 type:complete len:121 (+) Transcript_51870:254-616(+)